MNRKRIINEFLFIIQNIIFVILFSNAAAKGLSTPVTLFTSSAPSVSVETPPTVETNASSGRRGRKRKSPTRSVSPSRHHTNSDPSNTTALSLPSSQQSGCSNSVASSQEAEFFEEGYLCSLPFPLSTLFFTSHHITAHHIILLFYLYHNSEF
jgi:hypothetical protein